MASYLFKWHIPHIWFIALMLIGGSFPHLSQAQDSLAQSRPASQGHPAPGKITPQQIKVDLRPEACLAHTITYTAGERVIPQLDLVLVIDVTTSMSDEIEQVMRPASHLVQDVRTLVPNTTFALATLADYSKERRAGADVTYRDGQK